MTCAYRSFAWRRSAGLAKDIRRSTSGFDLGSSSDRSSGLISSASSAWKKRDEGIWAGCPFSDNRVVVVSPGLMSVQHSPSHKSGVLESRGLSLLATGCHTADQPRG